MSNLKFCKKCDNMLYIELSEETPDEFSYYCRKCGNKEKHTDEDDYCVSKINIKSSHKKLNNIMNEHTKYDPLLPLINLPCPNEGCDSNEAVYTRYDEKNMNNMYMCKKCNTTWKIEN